MVTQSFRLTLSTRAPIQSLRSLHFRHPSDGSRVFLRGSSHCFLQTTFRERSTVLYVITLYSLPAFASEPFLRSIRQGGELYALAHRLAPELIGTDILEHQASTASPSFSSALFLCLIFWISPRPTVVPAPRWPFNIFSWLAGARSAPHLSCAHSSFQHQRKSKAPPSRRRHGADTLPLDHRGQTKFLYPASNKEHTRPCVPPNAGL